MHAQRATADPHTQLGQAPQPAREEEVPAREVEAASVTRRAATERIIVGGVLIIDVVIHKWLRRKPNQ